MKKLLYIFILFQFTAFYSQTIITDRRFNAPKFNAEVKDNSDLIVLYSITFSNDNKKFTIQSLLQLGEKFSKFLDVNTIGKDSIIEKHSQLVNVGAKEINELGKYRVIYKKNILKDLWSNIIFVQERISKYVYQYEEPFPEQKWTLTNEQKTILGYHCKSAAMTFRGRNYVAWYTEEIPKTDGPYIFGGLPGLILKITDENSQYDFTAIGIEKKKMKIYWRNENTIKHISREDFRKIERNYFENPSFFLSGKAFDKYGKPISLPSQNKKYTPLELE